MRSRWLEFERYAVWGVGSSGVAAANLLSRRGKQVVASDPGKSRRPDELDPTVAFSNAPNEVGEAKLLRPLDGKIRRSGCCDKCGFSGHTVPSFDSTRGAQQA